MGWNDHHIPLDQDAQDEAIRQFREQLYLIADALCALRPQPEADPEDFAKGLLRGQELKHPVLSNDGQKLDDISLPMGGVFDPTILNKAGFTSAANQLFLWADHLSWLESDEEE